jgi:formylglycine-generating enzyme required for sulfatase activity
MSAVTSMTAVLVGLAAMVALLFSEAAVSERRVFQDCPDCPRMVEISGGTFTMGSPQTERERKKLEGPRENVSVESFAIGETEVTRAQYAEFVRETQRPDPPGCFTFGFISFGDSVLDTNASWRKLPFEQTDDHPVVCVSWNDAREYAAWLSRKTGHKYRLPSEAEWEYAARAGTTTIFFWGTDENQACDYSNGGDSSLLRASPKMADVVTQSLREGDAGARLLKCNDGSAYTAPVRRYQPNAFGLYDMTGNVWEWVEDCWFESLPSNSQPQTKASCDAHRARGGCWNDFPEELRSARRTRVQPNERANYLGFRVARNNE